MYQEYFGIEESPFSLTPDPRYVYMSQGHEEALAHLLYGVGGGGGCVLLTGEVGTGKTSVCRCLMEQLPPEAEVALILNPRLDELELLASICDELGIEHPEVASVKILVDRLNQHFLKLHAEGRHAVLIIDEAQNLSPAVLEQIRMLTNLETTRRKLLQIILIGQPELDELLNRRDLRQLAQRISVRYHLEPLSALETRACIAYRLEVAGLAPTIFDGGACAEIYKRSGGVPRLINSICDRCLLAAYVQESRLVDRGMARQAATEVFGRRAGPRRRLRVVLPWTVAAAAGAVAAVAIWAPRDIGPPGGPPSQSVAMESPEAPRDTPAASNPAASDSGAFAPGAAAADEGATEEIAPEEPASIPASMPAPIPTPKPAPKPASEPASKPASEPASRAVATAQAAPLAAGPAPAASAGTAPAVDAAPAIEETPADSPDAAPAIEQTAALSPETEPPQEMPPAPEAAEAAAPATSALERLFVRDGVAGDRETGLARLFALWRHDYGALAGGDACERANLGGLECLGANGRVWTLRTLGRPALLPLQSPDGRRVHAVLIGFEGDSIALQVGETRVRASAAELAAVWNGDYLVLWRPPAGYRRVLRRGQSGPDVAWLKNRLAELRGEAPDSSDATDAIFDEELEARVIAFQRSRPLLVDGIVGARTIIQLNSAAGGPDVAALAVGP